jgi:hypothetical protein
MILDSELVVIIPVLAGLIFSISFIARMIYRRINEKYR